MLLIIITIVFIFLQTGCTEEVITEEAAGEIAKTYLEEKYGYDVFIDWIEYKQIEEDKYSYLVRVKEGNDEYHILVDLRGGVIADNVETEVKIKEFTDKYEDNIKQKLVDLDIYNEEKGYILKSMLNYSNFKYQVALQTSIKSLMDYNRKEEIYSLLDDLNKKGVDCFYIQIITPEILTPRKGDGYPANELQLYVQLFETNITKDEFDKKYKELVEAVYWNENKILSMVNSLEQDGFRNSCFFITTYDNGNNLEISFYCESNDEKALQKIKAYLKSFDDTYFKLLDFHISFKIQIATSQGIELYSIE